MVEITVDTVLQHALEELQSHNLELMFGMIIGAVSWDNSRNDTDIDVVVVYHHTKLEEAFMFDPYRIGNLVSIMEGTAQDGVTPRKADITYVEFKDFFERCYQGVGMYAFYPMGVSLYNPLRVDAMRHTLSNTHALYNVIQGLRVEGQIDNWKDEVKNTEEVMWSFRCALMIDYIRTHERFDDVRTIKEAMIEPNSTMGRESSKIFGAWLRREETVKYSDYTEIMSYIKEMCYDMDFEYLKERTVWNRSVLNEFMKDEFFTVHQQLVHRCVWNRCWEMIPLSEQYCAEHLTQYTMEQTQ